MEEMLQGLANYGFPVVISIYLLVRMESKLDELTKVILKLNETITNKNA